MKQVCNYFSCITGLSQWVNVLMFWGVRILTVEGRSYTYGMREGKEDPCGDKLERRVLVWAYELQNVYMCVCACTFMCILLCVCVFQFYLLKGPRSRHIPGATGTCSTQIFYIKPFPTLSTKVPQKNGWLQSWGRKGTKWAKNTFLKTGTGKFFLSVLFLCF